MTGHYPLVLIARPVFSTTNPSTLADHVPFTFRAPEHSAPSTMASNIATATGSVLTTGIASFLCKPCIVDFTKVDSVGEGTLAIW